MPKPKNKIELEAQSKANFQQLTQYIQELPSDVQESTFPEGTMNRNIRDVLMHVHHWHLMFLDWYKVGMKGEKPPMPAKGYTWKMTPELNTKIWSDSQSVSLQEAKELLINTHQQLQKIIEKHTEEELFEKKRYKWTGSTSMGAYLISATASHYHWAYKMIKKSLKSA